LRLHKIKIALELEMQYYSNGTIKQGCP
jgi:hypothetical protein